MITEYEYLEENECDTVLDVDVQFTGTIHAPETTLVKGEIIDSKITSELLFIVHSGKVSGEISGNVISVRGECSGNIRVNDTLAILKGGALNGKVNTRTLVVGTGGILNGECIMKTLQKNG